MTSNPTNSSFCESSSASTHRLNKITPPRREEPLTARLHETQADDLQGAQDLTTFGYRWQQICRYGLDAARRRARGSARQSSRHLDQAIPDEDPTSTFGFHFGKVSATAICISIAMTCSREGVISDSRSFSCQSSSTSSRVIFTSRWSLSWRISRPCETVASCATPPVAAPGPVADHARGLVGPLVVEEIESVLEHAAP